jgi:hypothetical protein
MRHETLNHEAANNDVSNIADLAGDARSSGPGAQEKQASDTLQRAIDFLDYTLPEEGQGRRCVFCETAGAPFNRFFDSNAEAAEHALKLNAEGHDVFIACSTYGDLDSRAQTNVVASKSLWLDVDTRKSHDNAKYAHQDVASEAVGKFRKEVGLAKPNNVDSGYGLHSRWPFSRAVKRDEWKPIAKLLKLACREAGLEADPVRTCDEASILRLPGTHNHKRGEAKPVEVIQRGGGTMSPEAVRKRLVDYLESKGVDSNSTGKDGAPIAGTPPAQAHFDPAENSDLTGGIEPPPPSDAHKIAEECAVVREMRDKPAAIPEPYWRDVLGVLTYTDQGDEIGHEWSKGHPKYSRAETQDKIDRWRANATGATLCETLSAHRPNACAACPYWGKIKSPISLGMDRSQPAAAGGAAQGQPGNGSQQTFKQGAFGQDENDAAASGSQGAHNGAGAQSGEWPAPVPISSAPLPVPPWERRFLPDKLADMVEDYADSVPMNVEFVASNVTAAAGALLSSKVQIEMKQNAPWSETPNAWALNIAPPSERKTPGLRLCEDALKRVEERYEQEYQVALTTYQGDKLAYDIVVDGLKKAMKQGAAPTPFPPEPEPPVRRRCVTNDCTHEALGVIAKGGPVAVVNDEAAGLFSQMDDPRYQSGRAFYNKAYNGDAEYKVDRIGRGAIVIPRLCLSLICNIQPEPLMRLVLGAAREGRQADGFIQRFGMMTMPDPVQHTHLVDKTYDLFKYTDGIDALVGLVDYNPVAHGAKGDSMLGGGLPCFKLSNDAMKLWRAEYARLRVEEKNLDLLAAYRQHVGKQPKMIATVALVIHAVEDHKGDISGPVMERAIAASQFYLSHAKRVYYMATHNIYAEPARLIAARIARGEITGKFTVGDAKHKCWAGCYDPESTTAIMELLEDTNWIRPVAAGAAPQPGRPTKRWEVNP